MNFLLLLSLYWSSIYPTSAPPSSRFNKLYPILNEYVRDFPKEFRKISEERRYRLNEIVNFLEQQYRENAPCQLTFISTNQNSISQMAQAWAKTAAYYFQVNKFDSYSGGLNPVEINQNTIFSLEKAGFIVYKSDINGLDVYRVKYSYNLEPIVVFPKKIEHKKNPGGDFMAVILDQNAEINLNKIRGTYHRLFLNYDDPSGYDGSGSENEMFDDVCNQVAVEMFYVFSHLRKRIKPEIEE